MTRKRVKLAYILNNTARRVAFNKRRKGIIKKVSQLTTLCGAQACAIISNPFDSQTMVWPDLEGAKQMIERYQNTSLVHENKNMNQESFIMQRTEKARDQLTKLVHENHEKELMLSMCGYLRDKIMPDHLSFEDIELLRSLIDKKLKEINDKIVELS